MAYTYNIKSSQRDIRSQNSLLACHMIAGIINMFVTTFLVAHIYSFNGDTYTYLFNVGVYNLFVYLAQAVFYIPISKVVDKTNRVITYRFGMFVKAALVVCFIFFGPHLAKLLILAGVLNGLATAMYYASYNVIKQEMVSRKAIGSYTSLVYVISKTLEVVCPVLLGLLIDVTTFSQVSIVVFVMCVAQIAVSYGIKSQRPEGSCFNLKNYMLKLKSNSQAKSKIMIIYYICLIYGVVILTTNIINVCVMLEFGSTFSLGALTSVFAFASIIALFFVKKIKSNKGRIVLFVVCGVAPIIASIVFAIWVNKITVIVLNGVITITSIVYKYLFDIYRNGTLKEAGLYNEISEHHAVVEVIANVSRIVCFALLLVVALIKSLVVFKAMLVLVSVVTAFVFVFIGYYEKKYVNTESKSEELTTTQNDNTQK